MWRLVFESWEVGRRGLRLSCRWLVMPKRFVLLSWPPLQDRHLAKQEMTLLPIFLFSQGTGMSPGNPPPFPRTLLRWTSRAISCPRLTVLYRKYELRDPWHTSVCRGMILVRYDHWLLKLSSLQLPIGRLSNKTLLYNQEGYKPLNLSSSPLEGKNILFLPSLVDWASSKISCFFPLSFPP